MERQVVKQCPVTGRTIWTYEDRGPATVTDLRGIPVVPRASIAGTKTTGRKIDRRAA